MPFTQEQVDSYIALKACPYCGSPDICETKSIGNESYRMECEDCGKKWWEHWDVYDIEEIDD